MKCGAVSCAIGVGPKRKVELRGVEQAGEELHIQQRWEWVVSASLAEKLLRTCNRLGGVILVMDGQRSCRGKCGGLLHCLVGVTNFFCGVLWREVRHGYLWGQIWRSLNFRSIEKLYRSCTKVLIG